VAEIYFDIKFSLECFVVNEQYIIVERESLEFWKPLLDPSDCILNTSNGNRKYLFKENDSRFSVTHDEEVSLSVVTGDNEVSLTISDS